MKKNYKKFYTFYIIMPVLLLLTIQLNAQKGDTLFLRNGQVLIGEIKQMELGMIFFDEFDLGLLNIKISKVKTLSTGQPLRIETNNKMIHFGSLQKSSQNGIATIASGNLRLEIPLNEISSLNSFRRKFLKRLDGQIGAGYSYTRSSRIGRWNFSGNANYTTRFSETELSVSSISTSDSSSYSRDKEDVLFINLLNITPTWFIALPLSYQRNLELSIDRRFQEIIGVGNKFLLRKHSKATAATGLAFNQEVSTEGVHSGTLEVPVMVRYNYYRFSNPDIQIALSHSLFFNLTQKNRIRYDTSTDVIWQLIKNFAITLEFYTNYDSKIPTDNSNKVDYGTVVGLSYRF